ncbi:MAG: protease family protein [Solirubrobacteraceae bacterium]|jgi:membrane protease YdiL (CAAX protease family)|nr:protease family protein [Solirubrobacteraceae bacterium]
MRGWRPWTAWVALLSGFATTVVVSVIVGLVAAAAGADVKHTPAGVDIALTVVQNMALFGAAFFFARTVSRPRADDFGLRPPRDLKRTVGLLLGVWVAFFAFAVIWSAIIGGSDTSDLPERLGVKDSTLNLVAVTLLVTVVAPVGEELFFRGFFFGALRNWRGPWPAALITGLVFGAIHLGSAPASQLMPLAFFGVVLCLLYHWSGSLFPCIVLHAFNNALAFGVGEHWSGGEVLGAMAAAGLVALGAAGAIRLALGSGPGGRRPASEPARATAG